MINLDRNSLRERADEIDIKEEQGKVLKVKRELEDYLIENTSEPAVSAPQLGHNVRAICMRCEDGFKTLFNPMITKVDGLHLAREKDICLPGKEFIVPRHDKILVVYQKATGLPVTNELSGVAAELCEHHNNLLDGVLIDDFGLEVLPEFDLATDEEREELLKVYVESLKKQEEEINEEIKNDKELSQMSNAIKFMTSVACGETKIEKPAQEKIKLNREQRRGLKKLKAIVKK